MNEDNYRTIGAIVGMVLCLGLMFSLGIDGMLPGALFGASGAVAGGISGEKFFAWRRG
mgnify:CR=1 FL=1